MVASGTHVNSGCCFDFGNAETNTHDNGAAHMDAVNLTTYCEFSPCTGSGPWVEADMENGQYVGGDGSNPNDTSSNSDFVTAVLKNNGQTTFELKGGNAQSGGLSTYWDGSLPSGYAPMHQEGAIVLGTGGDNSNASIGSFFEGVMTSGFPTDAADNAVQANIVAAGYSGNSDGPPATAGTISGPGGQCVDVIGDDTGTDGAVVDLWNCQSYAIDQHWTHNSDDSLSTLGRCLDIDGDGTAVGTKVELWDCNGVGGQKWVQQSNGSLLNPQSGLCLDDPSGNTANGTQLQIYTCNGTAAQVFSVNGGGMIDGPGGQCVDVAGDDTGVAARSSSSGAASPTPSTSTGTTTPTARSRPSGAAWTSTATAPPWAPRSSSGTATASAARSGSSSPTVRCSTRSPGSASTIRAATPPTAPSCRSTPATAPPPSSSR